MESTNCPLKLRTAQSQHAEKTLKILLFDLVDRDFHSFEWNTWIFLDLRGFVRNLRGQLETGTDPENRPNSNMPSPCIAPQRHPLYSTASVYYAEGLPPMLRAPS